MIPRKILYAASALAMATVGSGCEQKVSTVSTGGLRSTGQPLASAGIFGAKSFEALDVDKDNAIGMWEAQADPSLVARFDELDRNGDGKLDRAEYSSEPRGDLKAAGG
jgi:EF hand